MSNRPPRFDVIETTAGKHEVLAVVLDFGWAAWFCAALTAMFGDEGRVFVIEQHEERRTA